jgi:hypothetical protein
MASIQTGAHPGLFPTSMPRMGGIPAEMPAGDRNNTKQRLLGYFVPLRHETDHRFVYHFVECGLGATLSVTTYISSAIFKAQAGGDQARGGPGARSFPLRPQRPVAHDREEASLTNAVTLPPRVAWPTR